MADYYAIFFLIGGLLFAAIAAYSVSQQRGKSLGKSRRFGRKKKYDDALLDQADQSTSNAEPVAPLLESASADQSSAAAENTDPVRDERLLSTGEVPNVKLKRTNPNATGSLSAAVQGTGLPVFDEITVDLPGLQSDEAASGPPKTDGNSSAIVTELVARVKNPEPIEQHELLTLFRLHDFKFHRKVNIYGLNQLTEMWRDIEFELPSARFVELGVAIQLADRDGGMSQKELHDFQQMALAYSNKFDAPFEFSMDIDEALKQAQILDQIGRRYDSMAVLNVVPRSKSGFRMADIESCARDLMMSTDKNGIFMKTRGQKHNLSILFRLACTDGAGHFGLKGGGTTPIHDLVIYMNVPATNEPEAVFQEMVKDANNLATWLDGKVVDRNGRVMTQRSYSMLMQQISDIAYSMQQDGLVAGDEVSKKLF